MKDRCSSRCRKLGAGMSALAGSVGRDGVNGRIQTPFEPTERPSPPRPSYEDGYTQYEPRSRSSGCTTPSWRHSKSATTRLVPEMQSTI